MNPFAGLTYSEAWLRDLVYENPDEIWWDATQGLDGVDDWTHRWKEYPTSVGRIDLLLAGLGVVVIAEFKKELADESAVAQVLRYTNALNMGSFICRPVVVAPSFTVQAMAAANAANVEMVCLKLNYSSGLMDRYRHDTEENHAELVSIACPVSVGLSNLEDAFNRTSVAEEVSIGEKGSAEIPAEQMSDLPW